MDNLGKRIKVYREQHGITQKQFAALADVGWPGNVSSWERGARCGRQDYRKRIAAVLGTPPPEIELRDDPGSAQHELLIKLVRHYITSRELNLPGDETMSKLRTLVGL